MAKFMGMWASILVITFGGIICFESDVLTSCNNCTCFKQNSQQLKRWLNMADCKDRGLSEFPNLLPWTLESIDVSYNPLAKESLTNMERYGKLLSLSLAHCRLSVLPDEPFKNLTLLRYLDLSGNVFQFLYPITFSGLGSLRHLIGLSLNAVARNAFQHLVQLRELDVTLHQMNIPGKLFHGLQLKKLSLNLTSARTVHESIFDIANHSLREVRLIGPKLMLLPDNLFYGLVMLYEVQIHTPMLYIIPQSSFKGFHYSRKNLSPNSGRLASAPLNVGYIFLSGMSIVPPGLFQYQQSVETLKLSDIDVIPTDVFAHLGTLNSLDLSGCTLREVPLLQGLSGLKSLNMSGTNLQEIKAEVLSELHSLKTLDLSFNNISFIPSDIFKDVGITLLHLNLSNNNIENLDPEAFENVLGLKSLDLSGNKLRSLSNSQFQSLHNLQTLDLSNNFLEELPELLLAEQEDLVFVNLSRNSLLELPPKLLDNTLALQFFDISQNQLTYIPPTIMQALDLLSIEDNPIYCDCDIYTMILTNKKSQIMGKCMFPEELNGTLLRYLNMSQLCVIEKATTEPWTSEPPTTQTGNSFLTIDIDRGRRVKKKYPAQHFTKSTWFLALTGFLSVLVFITIAGVAVKCLRIFMRSRVYMVNAHK